MIETKADSILFRPAATFLVLGSLFTLYWYFNVYNWTYPYGKVTCYAVLFAAIVGLQILKTKTRSNPSRAALWIEVAIMIGALLAIFIYYLWTYAPYILTRPHSDIGYTTIEAVNGLVEKGLNPYSRTELTYAQKELAVGYRGFHYGPFMMAGYLPSATHPYGYKIMSMVYAAATAFLLFLFARRRGESRLERTSNVLFVLTAYFMAERFWIELFPEGANDVFHILLLLIGLLALKKGRIFLAGLFTGLSIASKFAPGAFLVPFMPVRKRDFWLGFALGLTPYVPFLIWDGPGLFRNAFWLRVIIPHNWTSLYWITPEQFHWVFPTALLAACMIAVLWAVRRELTFEETLIGFALLLIIADVTQKQIHGNHLTWFYPLVALLFLNYRDKLAALFSARTIFRPESA